MYILICDDEPAVARQVEQLARQHLEQRGIPVQCAVCTRGEEVLARTDLAQYQLALLDVDLETMTGIALGRRRVPVSPQAGYGADAAQLSGCRACRAQPGVPDAAHPAGAARDRGTAGSDLLSGERPAQDQCLW